VYSNNDELLQCPIYLTLDWPERRGSTPGSTSPWLSGHYSGELHDTTGGNEC
jgi:hypothetical protein